MSFKCQIFTTRLTFHNVLELSCDVRIIILFLLIAILPPNIKCAKLPNPQIRLLINDEDLLHEKTSRHEAGGGNVQPDHSGEHFNLYRSELKRLSYETIHRILRDENEPSYRREDTELRYYQKRSPSAYEESHQLMKRSAAEQQYIALNYSKRKLQEFNLTPQLENELQAASSIDLSDNHLIDFNVFLLNDHIHTLNLSNNSFSHIPLSENTTVKFLNLNGNHIRESNLPSNVYLHNLYLSCNNIEVLASVNLSLLKNLEILDVSCNRLKSMETSFFPQRMHNLKHLNMAHNQIGSIYRETFYNLLSLNTLLLGHNNITDIDYETFLALPNLQYLDLSYNRLKGKSIRALQGITGLVALNIAFNAELGPFMQEFVASWSLKELDASGTGLCQIPAALAQSVRSLKLTHNWLKIINCGDLDSYPLLQYLDLSFSHIELIEDDAMGRLEILEVLMLDHNKLTKIPVSLPVSLEHLFLQNNNIMDIQSQSFQGLSSLKTLDLSHNKLLYLPDIVLPKLQTLNLQSAEIRGISQGIVHTLPRLNELFLEDNPIKCSDLLGIAEWASTCRLRTGKDEMQSNDESDMLEVEGIKVELKQKFQKIHNFYEKFEGEYCRKQKRVEEVSTAPACTIMEDAEHVVRNHAENNLKRLSKTVEKNMNLNLTMAIPLPSKKALNALTETEKEMEMTMTRTIGTTANKKLNEGIPTSITNVLPATSIKETAAAATEMQTTDNSMHGNRKNNNNTNILRLPKSSPVKEIPITTTSRSLPDETTESFKEFAFKDKPQQHSMVNAKKTFQTATSTMTIKGSAIEMPDKATIREYLQPANKRMAESTSVENFRVALLSETLKQNVTEKIIKKDIKKQTLTKTTTQMPPTPTSVFKAQSHETAINSPNPEMPTIMPTETLAGTTLLYSTTQATSESKINLFNENKKQNENENENEFKAKIASSKEIKKSFGTNIVSAATKTTETIATLSTSLPAVIFDVSSLMADNKEFKVTTSSRMIPQTTSPTVTRPTLPTSRTTKTFINLSTTGNGNTGDKTEYSTTMTVINEDENLASNNNDNNNNGQYNSHDNWHGLENNKNNNNNKKSKMLVTLNITTPITPHIVPATNENQSISNQHEERIYKQMQQDNVTTQHQTIETMTSNNVSAIECSQSNINACTSSRPQEQDVKDLPEKKAEVFDIGRMPNIAASTETVEEITYPPSTEVITSTTTKPTTTAITETTTAQKSTFSFSHKHEPMQLHIKDRHLIGTPLLMHKGDNLLVAADELIKPNTSLDAQTATITTSATMAETSSTSAPFTAMPSITSSLTLKNQELKRKIHTLDGSQNQKYQELKMPKTQRHHEPLEHKGETIKDKTYVQYKKTNADVKTKKPSLIMKKMTIVTKQHVTANGEDLLHGHDENEIHHQKDLMTDGHYQELKPMHNDWEETQPKHSTVNTPINKNSNVQREPQTFQHEHEMMLQHILHDQQQQQQHEKASQSEQWSDLRKTNEKDNHPGLILLVSSGLFVVLLLGLMHVYRCDVPWRRNSPTHHLRPHQRHNGSVEDDIHSFLSYNEGMQKWHHSTRQEAPYSSPLHNLHVRELQKTSATEKAATFKATASSYNRNLNRTHILPRTNSQSSSATTRTTSPSSSAILDDETLYIEMTPSTGQFAHSLQSELLPMELLNMAQTTKHETKETSADYQFSVALEEDGEINATTNTSSLSNDNRYSATGHSDLLAATAIAAPVTSFNHSNKTLYNTRKFGLW